MSISEIKRKSLSLLKGKWGLAVGLTFVYFLINIVLTTGIEIVLSGGLDEWSNQEVLPIQAQLANIIISILLIPFSVGVYWFYLSLVRGEELSISQSFSLYNDVKTSLKLIGASIVQGFFIFLWTLLFIIPGCIKALSYSQTFYILRDHPEYTILEAITESRKRMNGLKAKYFVLSLSFIGWSILCLLTAGIGFLWLVPYMSTTLASFYEELIKK